MNNKPENQTVIRLLKEMKIYSAIRHNYIKHFDYLQFNNYIYLPNSAVLTFDELLNLIVDNHYASRLISLAFIWRDTKEGYSFWNKKDLEFYKNYLNIYRSDSFKECKQKLTQK